MDDFSRLASLVNLNGFCGWVMTPSNPPAVFVSVEGRGEFWAGTPRGSPSLAQGETLNRFDLCPAPDRSVLRPIPPANDRCGTEGFFFSVPVLPKFPGRAAGHRIWVPGSLPTPADPRTPFWGTGSPGSTVFEPQKKLKIPDFFQDQLEWINKALKTFPSQYFSFTFAD